MSEPEISVIVPAYNAAGLILPCLRSIMSQSRSDWEAIVIDDGSTDATVEEIGTLADPRISLVRQANGGVSVARNNGLACVKGRYVMFLDGDDVLNPTALTRLAEALDRREDAVAAFGTFLKILPGGAPYPGQKPLSQHRYPDGDVLEAMLRRNFLANGGHVLIRTATAQHLGGFDSRLRLSEDWEFWCRLAAEGPFVFIGTQPEVFSLRVRPGSSSGGLSIDWPNHVPCLEAISSNAAIQSRFSPPVWRQIERAMVASQLWECGRVNFTMRRFEEARRLMLRSLRYERSPKRLAMLVAAALQRRLNQNILSRFRFQDSDVLADRLG